MNCLKHVLPSSILLTLYNSLVLPYLNYSILTWGSPTPKCNKLLTLQKRAVRTIAKTGLHEHSETLLANLKILKLGDLYHLNLGKFMYKHMTHVLPACFDSCFTLTSNTHSHNTRSTTKKNLHVSYSRTTISKNSAVKRGTIYWNSLDNSFKSARTLSIFARQLKRHFLNSY